MKNTTPMFPGFHLQTLRRKPRSAQQKLAEKMALLKQKSFRQIGEVFEKIEMGGPVTGTVSYTPGLKQLSFMPDSHLLAFASYRVARADIADSSGNAVEAPQGWSFTTIFDQLPPELPEF